MKTCIERSSVLVLVVAIIVLVLVANVNAAQKYKDKDICKSPEDKGGLVPDFTQTYVGKNGGICCAAAMANSLWYWDQHGYKDLVKQKSESKPNANWEKDSKKLTLELAEKIYGKKYVDNPKDKKSKGYGQVKGVQKYIDGHRTPGKEPLVIQYLHGKDGTYAKWEKELKDCEDVVASVTWRDDKGKELPVKKGGGSHALTGVGYDTGKKKFKVSHGWGNHKDEKKPYPDEPHKSIKDSKGIDYFQEYNMEITVDGRIKIPKSKNKDADLFKGSGGNADHVLVEGFYRISPGKKAKVTATRLPTPNPKKDQYTHSVENLDFNPIYQFALEVQVPFSSVEAPVGWTWTLWDPSLTTDITPGPMFRKPPEEEPIEVIWEPEWRGILWYTNDSPILPGYELDGFLFEVDSNCGHSEMASLAGFSNEVTSYITGEDIGLTTEFATAPGPTPLEVPPIGLTANEGMKAFINLSCPGTYKVLRGETLNFRITGLTIYGYSEAVYGSTRGTTSLDYDTGDEFSEADCEYTWFVDVVSGDKADVIDSGYNRTNDVILSLEKPRLSIEIQDEEGKSIESTTVGKNIKIDISTNLFADDQVVVKERDPDGSTSTIFRGDLFAAKELVIGTDGWEVGDHDIWVETREDGDYARGLDIKSDEDTIAICKAEIDIEAETTAPPKEKDVLFTVRASPYQPFNFETTHPEDVTMTTKQDNPTDEPTLAAPHNYGAWNSVEIGKFTGETDEDGIYKFVATFTEERTYTFRVWFDAAKYTDAETDNVDIDVGELDVTVETDKTSYVVGEDVEISGTASAGDYAIIAIDDVTFSREKIKGDGIFDYKWTETDKKSPGSYKIEVWIEPVTVGGTTGYAIPAEGASTKDLPASDASTAVLLGSGALTAELSTPSVALGDDFKVTGISRGADTVNILVVAPKGSGGTKIDTGTIDADPSKNIYGATTSVSTVDCTFEKKIDVDEDSDTGSYLVAVLSPGIDRVYNGFTVKTTPANFLANLIAQYGLDGAAKTQDQIMSMIEDATIDAAGSDDLAWFEYIKVQSASVILNPIADVGIGEPLVITGTTNREEGYPIVITVEGPVELTPATVKVEDGTFNATIDTTDAEVGTYTVKADDGDGHTDDATVEILETAPAPTPKEPAFEAIFAIAGLLAVAYFVLTRRK